MDQHLGAAGFALIILGLVVTLVAVPTSRAEMELAPPPRADFERAAPEIAPPASADYERARPEIEQPARADDEGSTPELDDGADDDQGEDAE